jgi:PAS domain S-box-containing protein
VDYAVITLDVGGRISSWSKGAEIIFGYTEDEMKGKYTNIIFTPEDRESAAAEAEMESAARQGRAVDERWHIRKDGSRFYMSGVMTPIMNNGRLTGYVKVARDMTATKLIQQQQDEFIGIASHELKTPVTSIKSYSELLLQYLQSGSANNALALTEKLNVQVDRLVALIKTLLDTTRISEGKLSLHVAELDLNSLIEQCVLDLQQVTNSHKISFVKEDIPNVLADGERIEQVMINLLINAITYSPAGGDIVVKTKSVADGVQVSVADQGIGIKDEIKQKIFDRFYQATGKQTDGFSGMGLGLYISAGIIVRHGGKIGVENGVEKGSVFYFVLPHNGVPKED